MAEAVASDEWTTLSRPLERALGKRTANALRRLNLETVEDLLFHFPFRLAHRGELMAISQIREGESVTVVARVLSTNLRPMNARNGFLLSVKISDGENALGLTFFGKAKRPLQYHERQLSPGVLATFSGTISTYRGELQLTHPEYELVEAEPDLEKISHPIPIYHATEKLPSWHIERAISTLLPSLSPADVPDPLPDDYRARHGLPERYLAICALHQPVSDAQWNQATVRMRHEEAFVLQAALAQRASQNRANRVSSFPQKKSGLLEAFDARLPYTLTKGQLAVGQALAHELAAEVPMQRLLQGDVGTGKTVVALRAMLQVVDGGGQAAFLVPTEVLAFQHLRTIQSLMGDLAQGGMNAGGTRVELLTGSLTNAERRKALARIASGEAGIIVGTHALLSDDVQIPFLGMAVIDEQQRFGVDQRDSIAGGVHTLIMTATPIPRTIAMSVFGDLDVSTLSELPEGRSGISTTVVPLHNEQWMNRVWERTREEIAAGGRVFVVCPRIESGDEISEEFEAPQTPLHAAVSVQAQLTERLPTFNIGLLHGRMKPEEKEAAMEEFANGHTPVLVSTTVVEVGVDVPDATLMVIFDAERFGLATLHQLRGRIGRGSKPGLCLAVTGAPEGTVARARVDAFASTTDGFELAEKDVELRSEGDVLGPRQSGGRSHLRFLSVVRDIGIIEQAREAAGVVVTEDPQLEHFPDLAQAVLKLDADRAEYLERG